MNKTKRRSLVRQLFNSRIRLIRFNRRLVEENNYLRGQLEELLEESKRLAKQEESLREQVLTAVHPMSPYGQIVNCEGLACSEWDVCNNCSSIDD